MTIGPENRQIWLASGSPRRRSLLQQMGLEPVVRVANVREVPDAAETPEAYALRLAGEKGRAVRELVNEGPDWLLAADTVVVRGGMLLEKPDDAEDAVRMLEALSGGEHEVITAFWVGNRRDGREVARAVSTSVRFRQLSADEILRYVGTGEPMDKAGAYGIQGVAGVFVEGITGSYFNVVGLPISEVATALVELGALEDYPFA